MKQRLGIAIALVHNPQLIILDEPTNGLDPQGIADIRKLIQDLAKEGKTILVSSHLLAEIEQVATQILIIHKGKKVGYVAKEGGKFTAYYDYDDPKDPQRIFYRSDHYNFAKNNIPVIFYFCGVHEDYHKPTDTIDKIEFDKMEKITRLVFYTAWELANREERIKLKEQKP
jgi:ABC-type multidrug transport system ATPase subunit